MYLVPNCVTTYTHANYFSRYLQATGRLQRRDSPFRGNTIFHLAQHVYRLKSIALSRAEHARACVCSNAASTLHLQLMQPTKDTPSRAGDCQPCGWRKKKRPPELGALFPPERSPDTYTYGAAVNSIPFRCSLRLFAAISFPSVMARAASRCKWNASHKQCVSMKLLEWKLIPSQWIEPMDGWMVRFQVIITVKMLDVEMEHIGK